MMSALRSEFRKLFTVRSTYFIAAIAIVLSGFLAFWVFGYKDVQNAVVDHGALLSCLYTAIGVSGTFLSFIAILLVGHEYRYSTIMYTLTASNRRSKVFVAKLLAAVLVALLVTAIIVPLAILLFHVGLRTHHLTPIAQHLAIGTFIAHAASYIIGSILFAFIVATLFRSLIGAFVFTLVVPSTVEQLLGLLLHDNVKYLPYTALGNLTEVSSKISYHFSGMVVLSYVVVAGAIAWIFFTKRDAN